MISPRTTISLLSVAALSSAHGALLMTAIYDGESSTPKGVELFVTSTGNYSGWTLEIESNAGTSFNVGYTFDATVYNAGDFIYVTSTATDPVILGVTGSVIADASFNQNGDDRIRLTDGTDIVDQYGVSGTDGTGEAWEYLDSFAVRNSGTSANGTFTIGDWTISAPNTLDAGNAPLAAALGTYTVPEPSSALLGGIALLGLLRRRR